jgi:hypothetical protein
MDVALFNLKCSALRLWSVLVIFPFSLIIMPVLVLLKKADWGDCLSLFDPRSWNLMIGNSPEILLAPYRVTGSRYHEVKDKDELPPYVWFEGGSKQVRCRDFEDAVYIRLKYNGVITKRGAKKAK